MVTLFMWQVYVLRLQDKVLFRQKIYFSQWYVTLAYYPCLHVHWARAQASSNYNGDHGAQSNIRESSTKI